MLVRKLDDRRQATEVFGEHDNVRELLECHVVQAGVGVEKCAVLRYLVEMGVKHFEHGFTVQSDVVGAGLAFVTDDDGALGDTEEGDRFETDLRRLIDNEYVEGRDASRAEVCQCTGGWHDPNGNRVLRLGERNSDFGQPSRCEFPAGLAETLDSL